MTLRRGFTVKEGERVLVVEDVITTGGSTRDTIAALRSAGADVLAAASIIDRSGGQDRKSTRLNSSHDQISYAVFCLKKKNTTVSPRSPIHFSGPPTRPPNTRRTCATTA